MGLLNTQTMNASVANGANIPVGNIVHRNSCSMDASENVWNIEGAGFYKITAVVTVDVTATGDFSVIMSNNGVTIAQAQTTIGAASDTANLTLEAVVYNKCNCKRDNITLTVSGAGTIVECDMIIERM